MVGDSFSGKITEEGLDKIINNTYVEWINLDKPLTTGGNESIDTQQNITYNENVNEEKEIKNNWLVWLIGIIIFLVVIGIIFKTKKR